MLQIPNVYSAYCFDEACAAFGTMVTDQLNRVKGKTEAQIEGKRSVLLAKLLGQTPKYRDPMSLGADKIKRKKAAKDDNA